jgi:cytosine/adenosine deaminase-related metal-dependent hydrolase
MKPDLLITNCVVVTVDPEWRIFNPGFIAISGDKITGVGPMGVVDTSVPKLVDAKGGLVLPGFVNTHTHVSMAAFRGASEDAKDRLTRYIFPLEARFVNRDLVREAAKFCLVEMARSGTTTFADMYYFEDEVAKAAKVTGMRALLGETVVDFQAPDSETPYGGIEYANRFVEEWKGDPLIQPCIAPHAPYTVDADHLRSISLIAEKFDIRVMMHVAEMDFERDRFAVRYGSVLKYLDTTGILSPRLIAAHMLYVDDSDIELAAKRGISVAHAPASNAKSGRPICPAWRLQEAGVPLGLATDGPLSGNGMDMQGIVNLFPKLQKVREGRRELVPAREALRAATMGGAEVLGMDKVIGSLEVGKSADLQIVDVADFNVQPVYDWYSTIVYALRPHNVSDVMVAGRWVVRDRKMTGFDQGECMDRMLALKAGCASVCQSL